jgi:hypothetical protein
LGEKVGAVKLLREADRSVAHVDVDLDDTEAALLREALSLTHETDPSRLLKTALKELVERQRFRSWVDRHEGR